MTVAVHLDSQTFLGHNQETYQELRLALQLNLRRQLLIAVCDNGALQAQLAEQLEAHFSPYPETVPLADTVRSRLSPIVTLRLDAQHPDLVREVLVWLKQQRLLQASSPIIPVFQIVGVDQLTRQSPTLQNRFLASLIRVDALLTQLDCRLLVWVPRPWLTKIRQSVPTFWRSRSGLFEFAGEPMSPDPFPSRAPTAPGPATGPATVSAPPEADECDDLADSDDPVDQPNLWTVLRQDLATLEPDTSGKSTAATSATAEPDPAGTELQGATSTSSLGAVPPNQTASTVPVTFAATDHEAFSAMVMPPLGTVPQDVLEELRQAEAEAAAATQPPHPPAAATGANTSVLPPLPSELAASDDINRLWQYIHTLIRQQAGPLTIARAYLALGQMSRNVIDQTPASPALLDFTVTAYERASTGLLAGETDWCDTLNDLASLYWLRSQQETGSAAVPWLHRSIDTYQTALDNCQHTAPADTLGRLYSNLATVYGLLANHDDPLPWLEKSLHAYDQALACDPGARSPQDYGNLQNGLGTVHWELAKYQNPQHHLASAIKAYEAALDQQSPQADPQTYAMIQNNLGIAYWSLAQHERPVLLLERAIAAYTAALSYRTMATTPTGCASTHNNLGTAWFDLAEHVPNRLQALQHAARAYETALKAADNALRSSNPQPLGFDLWATFHSFGVVHAYIAQALPEGELPQRQSHLQVSLQHCLLAYEGWRDSPEQLDTLVTALVYTVHLHFEIVGIAGQQAALSQVPGELLPQVLRRL
ncbi:tetratricopeptide repeat protein [Nodosilinea sp. P-1105]|uniref:tetratricopeptide repeat protein n=1 Tax=Nodosilinea sp. P-1105 TaxID=2546229 RepID=UPI001469ED2A|nr:tetratricopeptide repeat protein [Nodosilinea sp. P-1105]NMF83971.1 tetratricopeptide repeat protein [Nodosilinea sp. P-1105]